jgi:periplasmic mercuric ion binding protein
MKKIGIIILLVSISTLSASAQQPKFQWVTVKSANLKCWECKERLDKYLLMENKAHLEMGIMQWKINLLQGEIKFQYLPDRTNPEDIKAALNNAGFDADDEKAEEEAYKKLPPICKRSADGGGPTKGKPCHMQPYN